MEKKTLSLESCRHTNTLLNYIFGLLGMHVLLRSLAFCVILFILLLTLAEPVSGVKVV